MDAKDFARDVYNGLRERGTKFEFVQYRKFMFWFKAADELGAMIISKSGDSFDISTYGVMRDSEIPPFEKFEEELKEICYKHGGFKDKTSEKSAEVSNYSGEIIWRFYDDPETDPL